MYRPSTGQWFLRGHDGVPVVIETGVPRDATAPVPFGFFPDAGEHPVRVNLASYEWTMRLPSGSTRSFQWGGIGDVPLAVSFVGPLPNKEPAVYRPSTGEWFVRPNSGSPIRLAWGGPGDRPVPAHYLPGDEQLAIYRPGTGEWFIRNNDGTPLVIPWGGPGDVPMPANYLGSGLDQVAVFRPATAQWFIRDDQGRATVIQWGVQGDVPVPGDYLGRGRSQVAVYRPTTSEWFIRDVDGRLWRAQWGGPGDIPAPANYVFDWKKPSLAGTWRGTWTDSVGQRGVAMIAPNSAGQWVGVIENQTYSVSTSISGQFGSDGVVSATYRYPGDFDINFRTPLQITPDGHLRGQAEARSRGAVIGSISYDLTRYDLAGGSPFAGISEGTWRNGSSDFGDAVIAVDRAGRITGWLRSAGIPATGDVLGTVSATGTLSAQIRYPIGAAISLRGTAKRSGKQLQIDGDITQSGQSFGKLAATLTVR